MKTYDAHPAARAFPPLKPAEMAALKKSLQERGQLFPAVLVDGKLLDGRNRQEALRQLLAEKRLAPSTELKVVEWNGRGGSAVGFADAANDKRRHLTESQRAMIAAKLLPFFRKEAKERQAAAARLTNRKKKGLEKKGTKLAGAGGRAADLAVTMAGYKTSSRTVERADMVQRKDPALAKQVFEGELTVKQAEKKIRRREQDKQVAAYVPPEGKFQLTTVDFSWKYDDALDGSDAVRGGCPYPPMTLNEILVFVRGPLARCCDETCLLACWVTNPIMLDLLTWAPVQVEIQKLGFRPVKLNTWRKIEESGKDFTGLGNGQRNDSEQLVLFARGTVLYNELGEAHGRPLQRTVFDAPRGEHSEKPQLAYDRLEQLVPYTSRLEMFARAPRPNWVTSGAELAHPPVRGESVVAGSVQPTFESSAAAGDRSFSLLSGPGSVYEPGLGTREFMQRDVLESERSELGVGEAQGPGRAAEAAGSDPAQAGSTPAAPALSDVPVLITTNTERDEARAEVESYAGAEEHAARIDVLTRAIAEYELIPF